MSTDRGEFRSPFKNGKEVGVGVDSEAYHRQIEGVTRGMPNYVMSRSELMLFARNPANWLAGYRPKDTDATDWGSLMDTHVTDPDRFEKRYVVTPETCTATKTMGIVKEGKAREGDQVPWNPQAGECKKWKVEQESKGLTVLNEDEFEESIIAYKRLMSDPVIGPYLSASDKQVMVVAEFHDQPTGLVVPVKVLIDLRPKWGTVLNGDNIHGSLGDFKTCRDGSPEGWEWVVCRDRNYDVQAALFLDVYNCAHPEEARWDFRHILQENVKPYQPGRRVLESAIIDRGRDKYLAAFHRYCECLATGVWPSWDDVGTNNFKGWTITRIPQPLQSRGQ